jgi:uncharacterized protein (DUF362 family)
VSTSINRRVFGGGLLAATGALAVRRMFSSGFVPDRRRPRSRVAILHEDSYSAPLDRAGGLEAELRERRIRFVDLNRDEIRKVPVQTSFTGLDYLWLPRTVLTSDFIVSMPKVKTHHWAGVTLSMKNLFGVVPGVAYGWPKNLLHWKGIDRSILDINAAVPAHFVIADGIVGMEGNGPLHGPPRNLGRIVLADDPVAADFVCTRLMGLNPLRVKYLAQAAEFLGNGVPERIVHLGERLPSTVQPFAALPEFAHLRL